MSGSHSCLPLMLAIPWVYPVTIPTAHPYTRFEMASLDALFGSGHHLSLYTSLFAPILILISNAFQLILYISQGRYWKRIEQRRFAAVQGNQLFLAAE